MEKAGTGNKTNGYHKEHQTQILQKLGHFHAKHRVGKGGVKMPEHQRHQKHGGRAQTHAFNFNSSD